MLFKNRTDAGKKLAEVLNKYKGQDAIVYALPRGGVVVAREVADTLSTPLDLVVTRKIGAQFQPEYAIAAVSESGELVVNENEISQTDKDWFKDEVEGQIAEAKRRREKYASHDFYLPRVKSQFLLMTELRQA